MTETHNVAISKLTAERLAKFLKISLPAKISPNSRDFYQFSMSCISDGIFTEFRLKIFGIVLGIARCEMNEIRIGIIDMNFVVKVYVSV